MLKNTLPRRAMLGILTEPADEGVRITYVLPGSPADLAGVLEGDVLLSLGGTDVTPPHALARCVATLVPGSAITAHVLREDDSLNVSVTPRERDGETVPDAVSTATQIVWNDLRLRWLVTRPIRVSERLLPAVLYIPGHEVLSIECLGPVRAQLRSVLAALARAGVIAARVDGPGLGDSEGGPFTAVTLENEQSYYTTALEALRAEPGVDPERVYVLGHSLGACTALSLGAQRSVAGVITWGAGALSWSEYLDAVARQQWALAGVDPITQSRWMRVQQRMVAELFLHGTPLEAALAASGDPVTARRIMGIDDAGRIHGRDRAYWQSVHDLNIAALAGALRAPLRVLYGEFDWLALLDDNAFLLRCARAGTCPDANMLVIPRTDHDFAEHGSLSEAFGARGNGPFSAGVATALQAFIHRTES